ncbi:hypothetical protein ACSFA2_17530 [Variovorax sp. LT2P21]|uniref:hypothetical protein n=1 Tax=Variovorax sp. LT2P21 TaxID=3443731 RepID=UPI003F47B0B3
MPSIREELIAELEYALAALREDRLNPEEMRRQHLYLKGRFEFHRHLSEVEEQIRSLRDEVLRGRDMPVRCAYTEDRGQVIHMLTGVSGEVERDHKYLKKKSHSNEWLIITDPYFLQWDGPNKAFTSEKQYTEYIVDYIPRDLKKLELFILPGPNKRIFKKFNDRIRGRGTQVSYWETNEIHDRTIIRDNLSGTMMGTSFGGLGNKLAFVLDIPGEDLRLFMQQLNRIRGGA